MNYYIIQQAVWFVEPDKPTGANLVEAYNKIYAGKKIADYALKRSALPNKTIDTIVDGIEDDALKSKVEYALGRIKENNPNSEIIIMKVIEGKCVIIYEFAIKTKVVKTIEEIEKEYVQ